MYISGKKSTKIHGSPILDYWLPLFCLNLNLVFRMSSLITLPYLCKTHKYVTNLNCPSFIIYPENMIGIPSILFYYSKRH